MWHLTPGMWHMTRDRWGQVNLLSNFQLSSSYGLGVKVFWRYFHKSSVIVCRTAPATPGLLNTKLDLKELNVW